jgi:Zn-dependent M32 family carboxypeptidase
LLLRYSANFPQVWLNGAIHQVGSLYSSGDELMVAATGKPLDVSVFLAYLREKFRPLFRL